MSLVSLLAALPLQAQQTTSTTIFEVNIDGEQWNLTGTIKTNGTPLTNVTGAEFQENLLDWNLTATADDGSATAVFNPANSNWPATSAITITTSATEIVINSTGPGGKRPDIFLSGDDEGVFPLLTVGTSENWFRPVDGGGGIGNNPIFPNPGNGSLKLSTAACKPTFTVDIDGEQWNLTGTIQTNGKSLTAVTGAEFQANVHDWNLTATADDGSATAVFNPANSNWPATSAITITASATEIVINSTGPGGNRPDIFLSGDDEGVFPLLTVGTSENWFRPVDGGGGIGNNPIFPNSGNGSLQLATAVQGCL